MGSDDACPESCNESYKIRCGKNDISATTSQAPEDLPLHTYAKNAPRKVQKMSHIEALEMQSADTCHPNTQHNDMHQAADYISQYILGIGAEASVLEKIIVHSSVH